MGFPKQNPPIQPNENDTYEAIRALALRLHISTGSEAPRIITFIAARTGEGTSTLAYKYASFLADETGKKVLLIDAAPSASGLYNNTKRQTGIIDVAIDSQPLENALHPAAANLSIARWVGKLQHRAASDRIMQSPEFWKGLQNEFGYIVIDAPALQHSFDGIMLAVKSDATVMVVEAEATPIPVTQHLRDTLIQSGAKIAGVVLNKRRYYIPQKIYNKL